MTKLDKKLMELEEEELLYEYTPELPSLEEYLEGEADGSND